MFTTRTQVKAHLTETLSDSLQLLVKALYPDGKGPSLSSISMPCDPRQAN